MKMVRCKVCSKIEGIDKLVVPKFDYFIKHSNLGKCSVARHGMVIGTLTMHM
jgi:hypothetical protein